MRKWIMGVVMLAACASGPERRAPDSGPSIAQLAPARPMRQAGVEHVVFELLVSNPTARSLVLQSMHVTGNGAPRELDAAALADVSVVIGPDGKPVEGLAIPVGGRAVVYRWEVIGAERPTRIEHVIALEGLEPLAIAVPIDDIAVPVWRLPFDGEGWFTANTPSNTSPHRRSLQRFDGALFSAQRFAIDFVRVQGGTFAGDPKLNTSYFAYRQPVVAMADGIVRRVIDGIPENVPGLDSRAVAITYDTLAGNVVMVEHGPGHFATYAHLVPGEIAVREGARVTAGQVLGLVGNSGNSTEPHLHLHVCDAPEVLRCHGTPYAFERFTEIGIVLSPNGPPKVLEPKPRTNALPVDHAVLTLAMEPP